MPDKIDDFLLNEFASGELKIIFNYLNKVAEGLKGVIKFSAPDGEIIVAEAQTRGVFYPEAIGSGFIYSLNGEDLSGLKTPEENHRVLKSASDRDIFYIIYHIENAFYSLVFTGGARRAHKLAESAGACLRLCLDFAGTQSAADVEPMTQLFSRGCFQQKLHELIGAYESELELIRKNDAPLEHDSQASNIALVMFDIDNFKNFNDTYGHHAGDIVIKKTAAAARGAAAKHGTSAFLARYGGEEFTVLTKGLSREGVLALAESIRCAVESIDMAEASRSAGTAVKMSRITVSLGAAFHDAAGGFIAERGDGFIGECADALIKKADLALYGSKQLGKNRTTEYDTLASLCVGVIERKGDFIMIDAGKGHQINHGDEFEVYDSVYNGSSEVVSAKTSKKIGTHPRLLKGTIRVSKKFDRFDSTLMEKTAVCDIINETLPIGAGDICKLSGGVEKEIYSGDLFLPRGLYRADYYSPSAAADDDAISRRRGFMLMNIKNAIEKIMNANPAKLSSAIEDIREQAFKNGQVPKEVLHLSSDKILFCFENDLKPETIENFKIAACSKLKSMNGAGEGIRISFFNSSSLKETPPSARQIIRLLRIADFIGALYNDNGAAEFNCQTYRKYGLYNYYCARYEKALELFLQCERLFKQPPDFRLYQNAGSLAYKLGKTGLAIKYFALAETLDGSSAVPKSNLGLLYSGAGAFEKAASYYRQCLELDPDLAEFHNNLAYNLLRLNKDPKEALEHAKKAVELSSASQLSNFADTLAAAYMQLKNYKKAAETYSLSLRASGSRTASAETYLGLAEALLKSGENRAARLVQKALKYLPTPSKSHEPV
ncbi:MAG: hypothetical protein A2008_04935 [Candidatus Wallbacteria bacterium GWC2_49_35]|uniref:GGDEF domain-containing protein n=1 Tax=Candidatus Wallbacteria bacterium GWC2_49_35 TaxID=1817813 RepID=A0A1F7WTW0_9BACT|nr:MAG: hypothetical protein A2008_04935 [Candidatus Wallbacteria bacterium GWC2_49_35]